MSERRPRIGDLSLAARLRRELEGEVLFDPVSRGLYSTDASIYQIEPVGVVVPRTVQDVRTAIEIAAQEGVPVLPRGAGTSQGGQAVGRALVVDTSKHLGGISRLDVDAKTVRVEPGVVLDDLNRRLAPHGLFYPVDVATASRATLGGMAGNNSSGARSIRYGIMADRVRAIEAILADGTALRFGEVPEGWLGDGGLGGGPLTGGEGGRRHDALARHIWEIRSREAAELARRVPKVLRHVAGYNLHRLERPGLNLAPLLVGSEGTLAFFTSLELDLARLPPHRLLGICRFPDLESALDAVQHIVTLDPTAVELMDDNVLRLACANPTFRPVVERVFPGNPGAVLVVEFSAFEERAAHEGLNRLEQLMGDLGHRGPMRRALTAADQARVWGVRKAGLSIVMSSPGDVKPVSFMEDCAVPLPRLAEFGVRVNEVFDGHRADGTWYAHASVGCLHVRPSLNLKQAPDVGRMRAIASEVHEIVLDLGGSHSGEHGDGLVRSEFIEGLMGRRLAAAFGEVKQAFDPRGLMNPGKIVDPPRMDDRSLMRYRPGYAHKPFETTLDWSRWGGLAGAAEMCNNNGACRKADPGTMCPSYRVTGDEKHVTRGRANALRLALTGQLGSDAMRSPEMKEVFDLCIGCKACRRECPAGVDVARMKVEFLHHYRKKHPAGARDLALAHLPRLAARGSRLAPLINIGGRSRLLRGVGERLTGIARERELPRWSNRPFRNPPASRAEPDVLLLVDTFSRYFEPENARAAMKVLAAGGYRVEVAGAAAGRAAGAGPGLWAGARKRHGSRPPNGSGPRTGSRPLCCGRTYLNAGLVEEARTEARRLLDALSAPRVRDATIVGLEPSCLLTLRDEIPAMLPGAESEQVAERALLLEELLVLDEDSVRPRLDLQSSRADSAFIHGHCHQKAFGVFDATPRVINWIPGLEPNVIKSGCCGMAGSFGYEAEHYELSMKMAELDLLPAVRAAAEDALVIADGTSCRSQIAHGSGREAVHAAVVLAGALGAGSG
ncbi:MAG: FAD-binding protein [Gammaproteobacteria bacterium]|nr:FAD-binding protein [Gammaproteobacteria bacterium]